MNWGREHSVPIRIGVLYSLFLAGFLTAYSFFKNTSAMGEYLGYTADATGFLANALGLEAEVRGNLVQSGPFAAGVVADCTSLAPLAIFLSGVFAFPASFRWRIGGAALGTVVLTSTNLLRTTSLLYIGVSFPGALDVAHILVWQSLTIVLSVGLWILWHRLASRRAP